MSIQHFVEGISVFMREHEAWAAPIAFLVAFGESLCFASIVWPGWAILVGFRPLRPAALPAILMPMVIAAGLGGALGRCHIGSAPISKVHSKHLAFKSHPDLIPRGEAFFNKYGTWSVFLGHFVGPVRAVIRSWPCPHAANPFRSPTP
jgi:membrane protein DedA with SNARE-associated domain